MGVITFPGVMGENVRGPKDTFDDLIGEAMRRWKFRPDFLVVVPEASVASVLPFVSADYSYLSNTHLVYGFEWGEHHHVPADLRATTVAEAMREIGDAVVLYRLDEEFSYYEKETA